MKCLAIAYRLIVLLSGLSIANLEANEELPLATGEFPPYYSQSKEEPGFAVEIVSAAVHEMGMIPRYSVVPWARAEKMTEAGEVFASFPYVKSPERERRFNFSAPIFSSSLAKTAFFYYQPKNATVTFERLEDLRSYKIAGRRGFYYVPIFEKAELDVLVVNSDRQMIQLLKKGRVDLAPMDSIDGWNAIKEVYPNDIQEFVLLDKRIDEGIEAKGGHLMVSKQYPNADMLSLRFNKALSRIRENGVYQMIQKKYGVEPE